MSQSQKCLPNWVIKTHKDWTGCSRAPEQTAKSTCRLCQRHRFVPKEVFSAFKLYGFGLFLINCFVVGASEPRNMAYMNRLGIWGEGTPFKEFSNFIQAVERRSVLSPWITWLSERLLALCFYLFIYLSFNMFLLCWFILEVLVPWKLLPWIWNWEECTLLGSWASRVWHSRLRKSLWHTTTSKCITSQSVWYVLPCVWSWFYENVAIYKKKKGGLSLLSFSVKCPFFQSL